MNQISRRKALGLTAAATAVAAATAFSRTVPSGSSPAAAREGGAPNVLFLMCDQLNARALGCYGGPIPTPNLDRLCRAGVRFDDAVCTFPICSPNRAAIITGLYPHSHRIVGNVDIVDYPTITAPPTEQGITVQDNTTGKLLSGAGYDTHQYGKWHLHGDMLPWYPDTYGEHLEYAREMSEVFARVKRQPRSTWMDWYGWALPVSVDPTFRKAAAPLAKRWTNPVLVDFVAKAGRLELPLDEIFDVRVADHAIHRLNNLTSKPFFITASMDYPHDPNVVPSPYYEMFSPEKIELPENFPYREIRFDNDRSRTMIDAIGVTGLRQLLRLYYGAVSLIDHQVGRILDALEQSGRANDTIVVFTTDHGDMAGGHGMFWKSTLAFYDEVVRIPLIISYPRRIHPGRIGSAVSSADLMPTLLELTGNKYPTGLEGRSLASSLLGNSDHAERPYVFCERITYNPARTRQLLPGMRGSFMIRGQGWKYIRYSDGGDYLYHLANDPGEVHNVVGDAAYKREKNLLRAHLEEWLEETNCPDFVWKV